MPGLPLNGKAISNGVCPCVFRETAFWTSGADGCAQYLPPVLVRGNPPPQTIISLPIQTAVCRSRPSGALFVLVRIQVSVLGLYLPPVFKKVGPKAFPPQTIISPSARTAV